MGPAGAGCPDLARVPCHLASCPEWKRATQGIDFDGGSVSDGRRGTRQLKKRALMDPDTKDLLGGLPAREKFQTTIWSEIVRAGDSRDSRASEALEQLCSAYWYPIYAFIRRRGHDAHEAQDLTQGFFTGLLERNYLRTADSSKGKFRSFLITAVKWHLANEWDRANGPCGDLFPRRGSG